MPAGLSKREQQGVRSREEILDAAEALMSTRGYAATSISELARSSGLPASSIYWHFASKAGVLAAVMERGAQRFFRDSAVLGTPGATGDPAARLLAILNRSSTVIRDHPQFLRLFLLLLLGIDAEGTPSEVVLRVRREGAEKLSDGMRWAYESWGEAVAEEIARRLTTYAVVLFDGVFIASQIEPAEAGDALVRQCVDGTHVLAEAIRAELTAIA